jgi:hypothetical protein
MTLPGGLWRHGECRRDWSFRPLTGEIEMSILEAGRGSESVPQRVTAVLSTVLAELGGAAAQRDAVRALSVADRQYLMRRIASLIGLEESWIAARCLTCGAGFDVPVRESELPVKPAGEGYPFADVETSLGPVRFRVPVGADQEAIAAIPDLQAARRALALRCAVAPLSGELSGELSDEDLDRAEQALEAIAPEVATQAQAACPDCGRPATVELDPYHCLGAAPGGLFLDIHILASAYHWSEKEILALPRERRRLYLSFVDRSRGMVS